MDKFDKVLYEFKVRHFKGLANALMTYITVKNLPKKVSSNIMHAVLEVSSICNLNCKFCEYSYWDHEGKLMDYEVFKKIIDQLPFLYKVNIGGIGEPLLNPDIYKMIRYMKNKKTKSIMIVTNGTLLSPDNCKKLINSGVSQICVSLAASTKKTYNKMRPNDNNFEKIKKNIRTLVDMRNKNNINIPIYVNAVLMKENIKEIPSLVELCHSLGVDYLAMQEIVTFGKGMATNKQLLYNMNVESIEQIFNMAHKKAKNLNFKVFLPTLDKGRLKKKRKDVIENTKSSCVRVFPWYSCYITFDGKILPCCWALHKLQREDMIMGDATKSSIKEIWNNNKYINFRHDLSLGKVPKICRECRWLKHIYK